MRKSLVVFASPHRDGATARLLAGYLEREGIKDYELFDCFGQLPGPCDDCGYCKKNAGCSKRDLDDFYRSLENCDRLIFATPVYNAGLPAPLKALIDRLQVYFNARFVRGIRPPIKQPKTATLLLCSGANRDYRETVMAQILPAFTVINAKLQDCVSVTGTDGGNADALIQAALQKTDLKERS